MKENGETRMDSILQNEKECYICKAKSNLHLHHVFFGTANRRLSDEDGCVVWLCQNHHTGINGVHTNRKTDLTIKIRMQRAWMEHYGKDETDFIRRYGRNYL